MPNSTNNGHTSDPFLWGVSTSGFQHEGGYNAPGEPLNNWHAWETSGKVERSGRATDFWNDYEADFDLALSMGLTAFRLSVEWSRIQPSTSKEQEEPPFSEAALEHYARILIALRRRNLEPLVTLFHFASPAWLGTDAWLDAKTPERFVIFARHTVAYLNERLVEAGCAPIRWMITVNEPNMLVTNTYLSRGFPAQAARSARHITEAYQNLLLAHVRAYRSLHALYEERTDWGRPMISFNNYASDLYWTDKFCTDLLFFPSTGQGREQMDDWLKQRSVVFDLALVNSGLKFNKGVSYAMGWIVKQFQKWLGPLAANAESMSRLLDLLFERPEERPLDYLAFDYYDPFVAHAFHLPQLNGLKWPGESMRQWLIESLSAKWWDWRVLPQGIGFFCQQYAKDYPGLPILIAENGMAQRVVECASTPWRGDRTSRSQFLQTHIAEVNLLRKAGVPIVGYFHWSLTDNYEWGFYEVRFGLFRIDFCNRELPRIAVDASGDNAAATYARLIQESQ